MFLLRNLCKACFCDMIRDMKTSSIHDILLKNSEKKSSFYHIALTFCGIITIRFCIEIWIGKFIQHDLDYYYFGFLHTLLFFYLVIVCCVWLTMYIAKTTQRQTTMLFLYGFILVIFPPIIDHLISLHFFKGANFLSYYLFDDPKGLTKSFLSFFGDRPRDGITYGTRSIIALTICIMGAVTFLRTKSILRVVGIMIITYTLFFFFSALPSILTYIFTSAHFSATGSTVAGFIASPTNILNNAIDSARDAIVIKMTFVYIVLSTLLTLYVLYKAYPLVCISLLRNIRPIQSLYHIGLISVGFGIALIFGDGILLINPFTITAILILFLSAISAWYSTVIFNDIIDIDIDRISNRSRPLITQTISKTHYSHIGVFLFFLSIILVGCVNYYAIIPLILYHGLSFIYNTPPLRLKRFPVLATFIAALASFCLVIIGYITLSNTHSLQHFPPHIAYLLIIVYTISLPIKDLKDIAGDKKNRIFTIPVLCGEKYSRLIIAVGIFFSFMYSVFTFNDRALLFPAILAGILSFWTLVGTRRSTFVFNAHSSVGLVFLIVSLYSLILMFTLIY